MAKKKKKPIQPDSIAAQVVAARGQRTQCVTAGLMGEAGGKAGITLYAGVEQGAFPPSVNFLIALSKATGTDITITPDTPYCLLPEKKA